MRKTAIDRQLERESMTDDQRRQLAEVEQALAGARDDSQDWYKSWCETVTERDAARRYAARWKEVARRAHGMSVSGWYEVGLAWDERHAADQRAERLEAALRAIIDTDTHGKNVRDESGTMRPTGQDFCGRCNRHSFHPHAADCPIALAAVLVGL